MAGPTTIDWGDGTAVQAGPEQGNVSHQYATPGTYQVKVCSTAEPTKCTTKPVTVPFGGGTTPTATPTKVAGDTTGRTVSLAWSNMGTGTVSVNWGDGTPVATGQTAPSGTLTHQYAEGVTGAQTITVTNETTTSITATASFTPGPETTPAIEVVADGTNPMIGNATLSGFQPNTSVTINWGENGGAPQTAVAIDGAGAGTATKTYDAPAAGIAQTVTATGEQDATKTATGTFTPTAAPTTITVTPTEGANANQASLAYDNTGNGTVSIDWGDGTAVETAQPESAAAKTHDYAAAGTFTILVTDEDLPSRTGTVDVTIPFP